MKQIFILFFSILFTNILLSNCEIGKPTLDILPCDANGNFYVILNFDYAMVGNEGFKVQGNGKQYGSFQYGSLPVTIGPFIGNGTSSYKLVVKDLINLDCNNFVEFASPQCNNCEIWDLVVDTLECTGKGKYAIEINFNFQDQSSDYFFVYQNGVKIGKFLYSSLPLIITNIYVSGKNWDLLKIVDSKNEDCFDAVEFPVMDCGSPNEDCKLSNLNATVTDCDSLGKFFVTLNFDYTNQGSLGFNVFGNGINYGIFEYSQVPITLGPLMSSSEKEWEFIVKDKENPNCNVFKDLGIIDCKDSCFTFKINIDPLECTSDSTYALKLNFKTEDAPDSTFSVFGNGVLLGVYQLKKLPLLINSFPGTGSKFDTLTICLGSGSADCCHSYIFEGFECQNQGDCKLFDLTVTTLDCITDSSYNAVIDFEHQNTVGSGFDLIHNGKFIGYYLYSQLPLKLVGLVKSGNKNDYIKVFDNDNGSCFTIKEYESPNCGGDCKLYDLGIVILDCISDSSYNAIIDFKHENTVGNGFDLFINGKFIGYHLYSELPLTIVGIVKSGNTNDNIKVSDNDNEACFTLKGFKSPNCEMGDCKLYELSIEILECTSDSTYNAVINFLYENTSGNGFKLIANGKFIGNFLYSQLPLTVNGLLKSGNKNDYIKVFDKENEMCFKIKEYESPKCENMANCFISDLSATVQNCVGNKFNVLINFDHTSVSSTGFMITGNGKNYGSYLYTSVPIKIKDLEANNTEYVFVVTDLIFADCQKETFLGKVDCGLIATHEEIETFQLVNIDFNQWRVKTNISERIDCTIYQIDGKMISNSTLTNDLTIDLNAQASGAYLLVLKSGSDFKSFKLIKK